MMDAVGSYGAVTSWHNINANISMMHLVWSSKLRAIGLAGPGAEGVMALVLNAHVQCDGPDCGMLAPTAVNTNTLYVAELRREVRLLRMSKWFQVYLFDLSASRSIKLCKHLPDQIPQW